MLKYAKTENRTNHAFPVIPSTLIIINLNEFSHLQCTRLNLPRILRIVETPIDGFEALPPLELGKTQVIEEQVVMVFVQVEARLKNNQVA